MPPPRLDWLARLLRSRKIEVDLSDAMERRMRLFIDRCNRGEPEEDRSDPDDDKDMAIAILACAERGLEADEAEHGLAGSIFGDVLSADVMEEGRRRRKQERDRRRGT